MRLASTLLVLQNLIVQDGRVQAEDEPCPATACLKQASSVSVSAPTASCQEQQHAQLPEQGRISVAEILCRDGARLRAALLKVIIAASQLTPVICVLQQSADCCPVFRQPDDAGCVRQMLMEPLAEGFGEENT